MKAKKIISIALAITMLLMTPMQAVFAEGQQEVTEDANIEMKSNDDSQKLETTENVPDVTLHDEKINNDTVEENQENEITQQTDKLNYVVVNKKYIEQGDEQQIVVSVGNGIIVEAATLNYHRVSDGKTYQAEMTQSNEEALMFDMSYVKNAETGEYQLDSLDYSVSGENRKIEFSEAGIDAKYGTHSALNMFDEFSMIDPGPLARYVGFTENEVKKLCEQYQMDMAEIKNWYDGYSFENGISIYSPRSVVNCMRFGKIGNYWNQTETFEALRIYIEMNFEGLKDDVISMIAGNAVPVNTGSFANDMSTFHTEDDVLTLLIHLGYVSYDYDNKTVKIPNEEVRTEYVNSISASTWGEVSKALKESADTLEAIWQKRPKQVAEAVRQAHFETSHIQYNDENALSYTISLALYAARNFYVIHRELAGGKGFADLVFLPRKKFPEKPAIVVELKWDKTAEGAIAQIKNKEYCRSLEEYEGNILLVGVNYNKQTKEHECVIEEYVK